MGKSFTRTRRSKQNVLDPENNMGKQHGIHLTPRGLLNAKPPKSEKLPSSLLDGGFVVICPGPILGSHQLAQIWLYRVPPLLYFPSKHQGHSPAPKGDA